MALGPINPIVPPALDPLESLERTQNDRFRERVSKLLGTEAVQPVHHQDADEQSGRGHYTPENDGSSDDSDEDQHVIDFSA